MTSRPIDSRPIADEREWREWRRRNVNASEVAALFGLHPYKTSLELWGEKSGLAFHDARETAQLRRGRIMEPSVPAAVHEERPGWIIKPSRTYWEDPRARIGATPDFRVWHPTRRGVGILQAKTVAPQVFKREWTAENPPFWIVLQLQTELMLTGATWGVVAALLIDPWRFDVAIYEIEAHAGAHKRIRQAVQDFWQAVDSRQQPRADFERDSALLSAMYPVEQPGAELDLRHDNRMPELVSRWRELTAAGNAAEAELDTVKAEIKERMGSAAAANGNGWRITWKTQHWKEQFRPARSGRVLRVTDKQGNLQDGATSSESDDKAEHVKF